MYLGFYFYQLHIGCCFLFPCKFLFLIIFCADNITPHLFKLRNLKSVVSIPYSLTAVPIVLPIFVDAGDVRGDVMHTLAGLYRITHKYPRWVVLKVASPSATLCRTLFQLVSSICGWVALTTAASPLSSSVLILLLTMFIIVSAVCLYGGCST